MRSIAVVDFGCQYTQLIAKRLRQVGLFSTVIDPGDQIDVEKTAGIVLSGGPACVVDEDSPDFDFLKYDLPVLGICYGAQLIAKKNGGTVLRNHLSEFGSAINVARGDNELTTQKMQVWMSHNDTIVDIPDAEILGSTSTIEYSVFKLKNSRVYGVQFHPEVVHTHNGEELFRNFGKICGIDSEWTEEQMLQSVESSIRGTLNPEDEVVLGVSGGVDSSVSLMCLRRFHDPKKIHPVLIDNGFMRQGEVDQIVSDYKTMGVDNLVVVDASDRFLSALKGLTDPEQKRKAVGKTFIDVFVDTIQSFPDTDKIKFLGQGTIYPDVIESHKSNTIKSHHNVGGLPEKMHLKLVEPLRMLFKDDVRRVGKSIGLLESVLHRQPFPGPGLSIRIVGEVTQNRLDTLRRADAIVRQMLKQYDIWQLGTVLHSDKSVGVKGDKRFYGDIVTIRAVKSVDGMTAEPFDLSVGVLSRVSTEVINRVPEVSRVLYDVSTKPPATIEFE